MPDAVGAVFVTHGHVDHCTLASEWQRAGAEVWIAGDDAARLAAGGRDPGDNRRLALDFLAANGVPKELVSAARTGGRRPSVYRGTRMGRANAEDAGRLGNLRSISADHGEWPA